MYVCSLVGQGKTDSCEVNVKARTQRTSTRFRQIWIEIEQHFVTKMKCFIVLNVLYRLLACELHAKQCDWR